MRIYLTHKHQRNGFLKTAYIYTVIGSVRHPFLNKTGKPS